MASDPGAALGEMSLAFLGFRVQGLGLGFRV